MDTAPAFTAVLFGLRGCLVQAANGAPSPAPGALATVQDNGRFGSLGYGVGTSGAMDHLALALGNTLARYSSSELNARSST